MSWSFSLEDKTYLTHIWFTKCVIWAGAVLMHHHLILAARGLGSSHARVLCVMWALEKCITCGFTTLSNRWFRACHMIKVEQPDFCRSYSQTTASVWCLRTCAHTKVSQLCNIQQLRSRRVSLNAGKSGTRGEAAFFTLRFLSKILIAVFVRLLHL